jgi:hypothetical protein
MLRKTDVAKLDSKQVERALRERLHELGAIRETNGGTLDGITGDDAAKVREITSDLNILGERFDGAKAVEGAEETYTTFHSYFEEVDPARPHPGHGRTDGGGTGEAITPVASMWAAMRQARFDPVANRRVSVPAGVLYGAVTTSEPDELAPRRLAGVSFAGADRRFVFPALRSDPMTPLETSVDYVRQTGRTLADPADMRRTIAETTEKPESAIGVELAHKELEQVAHKVSGVPLIVFRQPGIRQVIDTDLRLGLAEALDDQALDEINSAGLTAGAAGATMAERIRRAVAVVEDAGFAPDTVALSPAASLALDLELLELQNSTGVLPSWGLKVRVGKSVAGAGFVFDSRSFATVHAGPVEIAAFDENDGATNSVLLRAELNAATTVDQEDAGAAIGPEATP